jgi:hypothetical protein
MLEQIEQHYTPRQVAELWNVSEATVRRLFEDDPAVLKISMPSLLQNRKRKPRVSLRIPASAMERVHAQQTRGNVSKPTRVRRVWTRATFEAATNPTPPPLVGTPERKERNHDEEYVTNEARQRI